MEGKLGIAAAGPGRDARRPDLGPGTRGVNDQVTATATDRQWTRPSEKVNRIKHSGMPRPDVWYSVTGSPRDWFGCQLRVARSACAVAAVRPDDAAKMQESFFASEPSASKGSAHPLNGDFSAPAPGISSTFLLTDGHF